MANFPRTYHFSAFTKQQNFFKIKLSKIKGQIYISMLTFMFSIRALGHQALPKKHLFTGSIYCFKEGGYVEEPIY